MAKCNDCGEQITAESLKRFPVGRRDVCDACMDRRLALVRGEFGPPGSKDFSAIQRAMQGGRGTAKRKIEKLRASPRGEREQR